MFQQRCQLCRKTQIKSKIWLHNVRWHFTTSIKCECRSHFETHIWFDDAYVSIETAIRCITNLRILILIWETRTCHWLKKCKNWKTIRCCFICFVFVSRIDVILNRKFKPRLENQWNVDKQEKQNREINIEKQNNIFYNINLQNARQQLNQTIESKFKNRKHPQLTHNCAQSDVNNVELRWKQQWK